MSARRSVLFILVVSVATGCSRTVNVPLDQLEPVQDPKARHRIHMIDGSEYAVRRFSTTDSTIVIDDLSPTEPRFEVAQLPVTLRRADVASVVRVEGRQHVAIAIAGVLTMTALFFAGFSMGSD